MKFLILLFVIACGTEPRQPAPAPTPAPPPSGGDDWETSIKPLVAEQCALSGCHAGASFLATGRAMKASGSSASLIARDKMPKRSSPNYDLWTNAKKAKLLNYLRD